MSEERSAMLAVVRPGVVRRRAGRPPASASSRRAGRGSGRRWLRRVCLATGAALLLFVAGARLHGHFASRAGLERFAAARTSAAARSALAVPDAPDQSLWAQNRVAAFQSSLGQDLGLPLAVLRIPRLGLEVPVWPGTDELTLNRGLGTVAGTAPPGGHGNIGIAGHRDGFFRVLKDIAAGDEIELETLAGVERFTVERTLVVRPEDVWVLGPTADSELTLVTCFPFYYQGSAPQRFIVRAARQHVNLAGMGATR